MVQESGAGDHRTGKVTGGGECAAESRPRAVQVLKSMNSAAGWGMPRRSFPMLESGLRASPGSLRLSCASGCRRAPWRFSTSDSR